MGSKGLKAKENKKILERLLKSFKFQIFLEEHISDPPREAFCSKLGTYLGQIIHLLYILVTTLFLPLLSLLQKNYVLNNFKNKMYIAAP